MYEITGLPLDSSPEPCVVCDDDVSSATDDEPIPRVKERVKERGIRQRSARERGVRERVKAKEREPVVVPNTIREIPSTPPRLLRAKRIISELPPNTPSWKKIKAIDQNEQKWLPLQQILKETQEALEKANGNIKRIMEYCDRGGVIRPNARSTGKKTNKSRRWESPEKIREFFIAPPTRRYGRKNSSYF